MSIRDSLIAYLQEMVDNTPGLEDVRVIKSQRTLSEVATPVLILGRPSYQKTAVAPKTKRTGTFTASLVSPHKDFDRAEDDLDDRLELILPRLITAGIIWERAEGTQYSDTNIAVDITITTILTTEE